MTIVTGDRYLELLSRFVQRHTGLLLDTSVDSGVVLKLNPVGLLYLQTRLEALQELEQLRTSAPVDYLRAYVADLGDHQALEQLRRMLQLLSAVKLVSLLPKPTRDPTPVTLLPFARLRSLELRGCDLSTSAARGFLELRPTLERLICYNSADALRHIFAERSAEIQDAKPWIRLAVVSCPCNRMLLMDESLQLLPAVGVLDLSMNCFAEVANLQKCSVLRCLDLGFNRITHVSSLNLGSGRIRQLILRNNALVNLKGIEKLVALEVLDLSYNLLTCICDIEALKSLSLLRILALRGNPISTRCTYRVDVLGLFPDPRKIVLDEMQVKSRESWFVNFKFKHRQSQWHIGAYDAAVEPSVPVPEYDQSPDDILAVGTPTERQKALRVAHIEDVNR